MKTLLFVFILLFVKVQGSFFDDFRGAISNINSGFGKLFGDVISDVKDTVYCTISAVEQVLVQNGWLDKRTLYNQKCKGVEKPQQQSSDIPISSHSKTVSKVRKHSVIHHKHSSRRVSHESEHSVQSINTTTNVLGNVDLNSAPVDSNQLAEISKILKQESVNISRNFKSEIKKLQSDNNQLPVEKIWEEIKLLNDLRQNSKNDTEVNEIRRIFDKLSNQMNLTISFDGVSDTNELKSLMGELQKYSSNNETLNLTTGKQTETKISQDGNTNTTVTFKDVALKIYNTDKVNQKPRVNAQIKDDKESEEKPGKSIFSLGSDVLKSFFKSMSASPDDIHNAKNIVAHSKHSDKVLNALFKGKV